MICKSSFLKLCKNDFVKGLVTAMLGAALGAISPAITAGTVLSLTVLQGAGQVGLAAGLAYLTKNLFTNSKDEFGKTEPK